ncbi:MAG TPA: MauE/DoxX family redox-associated membrane protein [Solirubrobacteraceae bacterium]
MPHAVAALVLAVAGVAKLRSPQAAARAVGAPVAMVRVFAAGEIALAVVALVTASAWSSVLMAVLYAGFSVLTLRLARAGAACGCFGAEESPASGLQSVLSAALSALALLSALGGAHAAGWIAHRPLGTLAVLVIGAAGLVYAIVLAYSELPSRWQSWSPV